MPSTTNSNRGRDRFQNPTLDSLKSSTIGRLISAIFSVRSQLQLAMDTMDYRAYKRFLLDTIDRITYYDEAQYNPYALNVELEIWKGRDNLSRLTAESLSELADIICQPLSEESIFEPERMIYYIERELEEAEMEPSDLEAMLEDPDSLTQDAVDLLDYLSDRHEILASFVLEYLSTGSIEARYDSELHSSLSEWSMKLVLTPGVCEACSVGRMTVRDCIRRHD